MSLFDPIFLQIATNEQKMRINIYLFISNIPYIHIYMCVCGVHTCRDMIISLIDIHIHISLPTDKQQMTTSLNKEKVKHEATI